MSVLLSTLRFEVESPEYIQSQEHFNSREEISVRFFGSDNILVLMIRPLLFVIEKRVGILDHIVEECGDSRDLAIRIGGIDPGAEGLDFPEVGPYCAELERSIVLYLRPRAFSWARYWSDRSGSCVRGRRSLAGLDRNGDFRFIVAEGAPVDGRKRRRRIGFHD